MMMVTPTARSQALAGFGFWAIIWSGLFKIESIAKFCKLDGYVSRNAIFDWISANKSLSLIISEICNLVMHPPENASSTTFALGGTLMNVIMIFVVLPLRHPFKGLTNKVISWMP